MILFIFILIYSIFKWIDWMFIGLIDFFISYCLFNIVYVIHLWFSNALILEGGFEEYRGVSIGVFILLIVVGLRSYWISVLQHLVTRNRITAVVSSSFVLIIKWSYWLLPEIRIIWIFFLRVTNSVWYNMIKLVQFTSKTTIWKFLYWTMTPWIIHFIILIKINSQMLTEFLFKCCLILRYICNFLFSPDLFFPIVIIQQGSIKYPIKMIRHVFFIHFIINNKITIFIIFRFFNIYFQVYCLCLYLFQFGSLTGIYRCSIDDTYNNISKH